MTGLLAVLLAGSVVLQVSVALLSARNLKLTSENFKHVLTWRDPNNESPVYYTVECSRMHSPFETVKECSNITTPACDLTKQLTNITHNYRVRVLSCAKHDFSKASLAVSLTPMQETILGPPLLDVLPCDRCLSISIRPPPSHLWNKKQQQFVSLFNAYPLLHYKVQLMPVSEEASSDVNISTDNYTFLLLQNNLLPNANYCVSVTVTASTNTKPSVPSNQKCVVTQYHVNGSSTGIILSAVCGVLLLVGLVLFLFGLDRAGYICRAKTLIPKVLKSLPKSERACIDGSEFISPTFSVPVDIISKTLEVEHKEQNALKNYEGGYASRKRLQESDTSGTTTASGDFPSAVSSSMGSSGEANSSAEEDLPDGHSGGRISSAAAELGSSSVGHLPASANEDSSNLSFDTSGVFNINLNSVSIADPAVVWIGFRHKEAAEEEAQDSVESHQAGIALDQHNDLCLGGGDLEEEEYCSDYEEEEESSENEDSDSHLLSGYMRR